MANLRDLDRATRIVIKCGTSTVSNPDGTPSLVRLSGVVESIAKLMHEGKQVILVTSGAVGCGRSKVRRNNALHRSFHDLQRMTVKDSDLDAAAYAAAGQLALMAIYETLFGTQDIDASQFLVTQRDFRDAGNREHLEQSLRAIQKAGMIPIVNENDAIVAGPTEGDGSIPKSELEISDNDSIAAVLATQLNCELVLLLSNVDGVYEKVGEGKPISVITPDALEQMKKKITYDGKSAAGRGGMDSKVKAAEYMMHRGVKVVIASGSSGQQATRTLLDIIEGQGIGTVFTK